MRPRLALGGFVAATLVMHAIVAWLAPLQADDWGHRMWAATHADLAPGAWLVAFARDHYVFSDLAGYVLAEVPLVHAVLTPLAGLAVVWGAFVVASRRLPRADDGRDVTIVVVLAALVWIAAPRCGLVYFYRPHVATWLYPTALALWFLAPLRCGWRPRGAWPVLVVLAGFLAATSSRQLGLVLVGATLYGIRALRPADRTRWTWIALAAVVAGTATGFVHRFFDFRGYRPSWDRSLDAFNLPVNEGGELITLVLGLVMLKLTIGALWPRHAGAPSSALADTSETLRWLALWAGYIVIALLGPRYSEAAVFPSAVVLCIAALPYVRWVMTSAPLRIATGALAVGIHLVVWSYALATYVPLAREFHERMAKLEAAPAGSVATVAPYRQIWPSFWAVGEDWAAASSRQLIAIRLFGLRDIEMSPAFRFLQPNPGMSVRFEVDGASEAQLAAAKVPPSWATDLGAARAQFGGIARRLGAAVGSELSARLVLDVDFAGRAGRPVYAAWYEHGKLVAPRVTRTRADDLNRQTIRIPRSTAAMFTEAYAVHDGRTVTVPLDEGRVRIQPMTADLFLTIVCDARRCLAADAFVPRF